MTEEAISEKKKMPKGGRKGGAVFPRYSLADSLDWVKKLVSKTHNGAQARDVIYSGVVGSRSGTGDIKISALKQYGFLEGDSKAYIASDLAKAVNVAPPEEIQALLRKAALRPIVFQGLFNTFQDDSVSRPKLKQRSVELNVHPEESDTCVSIYVATLEVAGLVAETGDKVAHISARSLDVNGAVAADTLDDHADDGLPDAEEEDGEDAEPAPERRIGKPNRGGATVTISVDSTLDTEKLAKQLALLRKYDVI